MKREPFDDTYRRAVRALKEGGMVPWLICDAASETDVGAMMRANRMDIFDERGNRVLLSTVWFKKTDGENAIEWLMKNESSKAWKVLFDILGAYDHYAGSDNCNFIDEREKFFKLLRVDQKEKIWVRVLKNNGFEHNIRIEHKQRIFERFLNDMTVKWTGPELDIQLVRKLMNMGGGIGDKRLEVVEDAMLRRVHSRKSEPLRKKSI
jgi:hypothetical protein